MKNDFRCSQRSPDMILVHRQQRGFSPESRSAGVRQSKVHPYLHSPPPWRSQHFITFEFPFRQRRAITLWFEENASDTFTKGRLMTTGHKCLYISKLAQNIPSSRKRPSPWNEKQNETVVGRIKKQTWVLEFFWVRLWLRLTYFVTTNS